VGFGVTLDDCADVSRDVSAVLDVEDLIPHHYHLEVSSPGLDRPLRSAADFARFAGRTAKVKLRAAAPDGQRVLRGVLAQGPEGLVALIADGKRFEMPLGDIAEAHLVFELLKQPKKATQRHRKSHGDKDPNARDQDRSQAPRTRSHSKAPQGKRK
jgi:ribosome maturation factor RimP